MKVSSKLAPNAPAESAASARPPCALRFGDYVLDVLAGCLRAADKEVPLRPKSFEVLRYLVTSGGRLLPREEILDAVWPNVVVTDESLAQCVSEIRRAIGDTRQTIIRTVPRRGYRFTLPVREHDAWAICQGKGRINPASAAMQSNSASLASRPSVAVLPFEGVQSAADRQLGNGMTEDILTELSRFAEIAVIATKSIGRCRGSGRIDVRQIGRELGAAYVLVGSIRRQDDRLRVTPQLVDAASGAHLWAERYERQVQEVFAVQDELARTIAASVAVRVNNAEAEHALLAPRHSWRAYQFHLAALEAFRARATSMHAVHEARWLVDRALELAPANARAYALKSKIEWWTYVEPFKDSYVQREVLERSHGLAVRSVQLAPRSPEAHSQLGWTLLFKGDHHAALDAFEHAFALNRSFVDNRYALALAYAGMPERAIDELQANIDLDPFQPFDSFGFLGHARYLLGQYDEAARQLALYASRAPAVRILPLWLAAAYAQAGNLEVARNEASHVLEMEPGFTIARWLPTAVYARTQDAEHLVDGLRRAGLPG